MGPFSLLREILEELRRIRVVLEGGKGPPLPPLDGDKDESMVLYTDDLEIVRKEIERDRFYELKGRYPVEGETLPGALSPGGNPWGSIEEALERDLSRKKLGEEHKEGALD